MGLDLTRIARYKTDMNTYENPSAVLESLQARIVALRDSL